MDEDAKAPNDDITWEAIDIFVFSNGQEYSPPRKYHLKAEELFYWETTLVLLARNQYGAMHTSINLYHLNGEMVRSPLELTNGGAYVAVVPPDAFIHSGYEKYLMKASKSWEKRQASKSSDETAKDGAGGGGGYGTSQPVSGTGNVINIITPEQRIKIIANNNERKQPAETRTSILRKMNAQSSQRTADKRDTSEKRNSAGKRNIAGKPNFRRVLPKVEIIDVKQQPKPSKVNEAIPLIAYFKPSLQQVTTSSRVSTTSIEENQLTEDPCNLHGKEVLIVSHLTTSKENLQIIPSRTRRPSPYVISHLELEADYETLREKIVKDSQNLLALNNDETTRVSSTIKSEGNTTPQNVPGHHQDNNVMNFSSDGNNTLFKLEIEVNNEGIITTDGESNIPNKTSSAHDINAINIVNTENKTLTVTKSVDSLLAAQYVCCHNNPQASIIKCKCEQQKSSKTDNPDVRNYFFIIPIIPENGKHGGSINHGSPTTSCEKEVQCTESQINIFMSNKDMAMNFPMEAKRMSSGSKRSSGNLSGKREVSINPLDVQNQLSTFIVASEVLPNIQTQDLCFVELKGDATKDPLSDMCTQTEWCQVLLEVRKHQDGLYTFHLPTLEVLKSYLNR